MAKHKPSGKDLASQALTGGISGGAGGIDAGSSATTGDTTAGNTSKTWGASRRNYRGGIDSTAVVVGVVALAGLFVLSKKR